MCCGGCCLDVLAKWISCIRSPRLLSLLCTPIYCSAALPRGACAATASRWGRAPSAPRAGASWTASASSEWGAGHGCWLGRSNRPCSNTQHAASCYGAARPPLVETWCQVCGQACFACCPQCVSRCKDKEHCRRCDGDAAKCQECEWGFFADDQGRCTA